MSSPELPELVATISDIMRQELKSFGALLLEELRKCDPAKSQQPAHEAECQRLCRSTPYEHATRPPRHPPHAWLGRSRLCYVTAKELSEGGVRKVMSRKACRMLSDPIQGAVGSDRISQLAIPRSPARCRTTETTVAHPSLHEAPRHSHQSGASLASDSSHDSGCVRPSHMPHQAWMGREATGRKRTQDSGARRQDSDMCGVTSFAEEEEEEQEESAIATVPSYAAMLSLCPNDPSERCSGPSPQASIDKQAPETLRYAVSTRECRRPGRLNTIFSVGGKITGASSSGGLLTPRREAAAPSRARVLAGAVVCSVYFEHLTVLFICANAATIGAHTDYSARTLTEEAPEVMIWVSRIIAAFFAVELMLRLFAYRWNYFTAPNWQWNILDLVVVVENLVGELLLLLRFVPISSHIDMSLTRLLRLGRIVRVVRVVRLLRYMSELRTMVASISNSLRPLLSTVVLLSLVVYIVGIYFTQVALMYRIDHPGTGESQELETYFSTLGSTVLNLFQTVTGGLEWRHMVNPMMAHISPGMGLIFCLYVVFTSIALMNIVTGVFVESALQRGREAKEVYMVNHLIDLFGSLDENQNGMVSWAQVKEHLDNPKLLMFFKDIDIDVSEAEGLFHLLDRDGTGTIDAEEFLNGSLRLRGPAKALDLQLVMLEMEEQRRIVLKLLDALAPTEHRVEMQRS